MSVIKKVVGPIQTQYVGSAYDVIEKEMDDLCRLADHDEESAAFHRKLEVVKLRQRREALRIARAQQLQNIGLQVAIPALDPPDCAILTQGHQKQITDTN